MEMGWEKGDGVGAHCSLLRSVSLMVLKREWPSPQLSFCGYLLDQILKDAVLDTNKSIFQSNLLHSGSWMPLTLLKWSGFWFDSYVLSLLPCQGSGIYTPKCEATGCWQCCFRGDEQRQWGCWDLAKGSQEVCSGCSWKNSLKNGGQPPCTQWGGRRAKTRTDSCVREQRQSLALCLCQIPSMGTARPALCNCASALHPSREADLRRTWLLNVPEESFTSALKYWRCVWGSEHRDRKGDVLLGTQRTPAAFGETTKEKQIAWVMWLGRGEGRERKTDAKQHPEEKHEQAGQIQQEWLFCHLIPWAGQSSFISFESVPVPWRAPARTKPRQRRAKTTAQREVNALALFIFESAFGLAVKSYVDKQAGNYSWDVLLMNGNSSNLLRTYWNSNSVRFL